MSEIAVKLKSALRRASITISEVKSSRERRSSKTDKSESSPTLPSLSSSISDAAPPPPPPSRQPPAPPSHLTVRSTAQRSSLSPARIAVSSRTRSRNRSRPRARTPAPIRTVSKSNVKPLTRSNARAGTRSRSKPGIKAYGKPPTRTHSKHITRSAAKPVSKAITTTPPKLPAPSTAHIAVLRSPTKPRPAVSAKQSRPARPSAAQQAVLRSPLLLSNILSHLPSTTLLHAQRTSRLFHSTIQTSLFLRQKLYLAATGCCAGETGIEVDNPWFKARFPDLGVYLMNGHPKWRPKITRAVESGAGATGDEAGKTMDAAFWGEGKSWRGMLLTQPPVKEIMVYARVEPEAHGAVEFRDIESEGSCASPSASSAASCEAAGAEPGPSRPSTEQARAGEGALHVRWKGQDVAAPTHEEEDTGPTMEEIMQASVMVRCAGGITMGMIVEASVEARRRAADVVRKREKGKLRKDSGYASLEDGDLEAEGNVDLVADAGYRVEVEVHELGSDDSFC